MLTCKFGTTSYFKSAENPINFLLVVERFLGGSEMREDILDLHRSPAHSFGVSVYVGHIGESGFLP